MITPAFPPNSSTTFFLPASRFIFQPTSGEPVNESRLIRSSVTSLLPVCRFMGKIETAPLGKSVLSIICASMSVDKGVRLEGFKMMGQPAAMAGAILCTARLSGKLKGTIPATIPTGKYFTSPSLPAPAGVQSRLIYSFGKRLLSSAATAKVWMERSTSPSAYLMGLPDSSVINSANCCFWASKASLICFSISYRLKEGALRSSSAAFAAAVNASSSSASPARYVVATRLPS